MVGFVRSTVVSATLASLTAWVAYVCLVDHFQQLFNTNHCSLNIFIAILSRRSNFAKRQTVRETWIRTAKEIDKNEHNSCVVRLETRFIIGDHDCPIPIIFRSDPYSCRRNNITLDYNNSEVFLHQFSATKEQSVPFKKTYRGFSFVIKQPIKVTRLAVHHSFVTNNSVSVTLLEAQNKEVILSVNVSADSPSHNQVHFIQIEPISLSRDFYGIVLIDDPALHTNRHLWSQISLNHNGFIEIQRAYYGFTDFESIGYNPEMIVGATLAYLPSEPDDIELMRRSYDWSQTKWSTELSRIEERLEQEMNSHKDIVTVNTVDVYRHLPEKVLRSMQFALRRHEWTHFLKTDDDCYLNVKNIISELIANKDMKNVWFGNFRRLWPTDKWSKWAENEYQSPLYPAFACGSGYVLSFDLVEWLVHNIDRLHRYQGEDVSMGIWLAAVNPYLRDDRRWLCAESDRSDIETNETFSFPDLSDKQMIKIHNYLMKLQ